MGQAANAPLADCKLYWANCRETGCGERSPVAPSASQLSLPRRKLLGIILALIEFAHSSPIRWCVPGDWLVCLDLFFFSWLQYSMKFVRQKMMNYRRSPATPQVAESSLGTGTQTSAISSTVDSPTRRNFRWVDPIGPDSDESARPEVVYLRNKLVHPPPQPR